MSSQLLEKMFYTALNRDPEMIDRFYGLLFKRYPETRALFFRNNWNMQKEMFSSMLMAIVDHLDDPEWLAKTLHALGERHERYAVTSEMYEWAGDCLHETIKNAVGEEWTADHEAAWQKAYNDITDLTLKGYEHGQSEPPL